MERRTFLGGLTAASFGTLLKNAFGEPAQTQVGSSPSGEDSFQASHVEVSGNRIFVRRYGNGPAILLVHDFPRTSLMWRFLAPKLALARVRSVRKCSQSTFQLIATRPACTASVRNIGPPPRSM